MVATGGCLLGSLFNWTGVGKREATRRGTRELTYSLSYVSRPPQHPPPLVPDFWSNPVLLKENFVKGCCRRRGRTPLQSKVKLPYQLELHIAYTFV